MFERKIRHYWSITLIDFITHELWMYWKFPFSFKLCQNKIYVIGPWISFYNQKLSIGNIKATKHSNWNISSVLFAYVEIRFTRKTLFQDYFEILEFEDVPQDVQKGNSNNLHAEKYLVSFYLINNKSNIKYCIEWIYSLTVFIIVLMSNKIFYWHYYTYILYFCVFIVFDLEIAT